MSDLREVIGVRKTRPAFLDRHWDSLTTLGSVNGCSRITSSVTSGFPYSIDCYGEHHKCEANSVTIRSHYGQRDQDEHPSVG
jgi:hypothetical protein